MPDSPILKLVFSVIFLQNRGVPRNEQFAAGAAAALIPGSLGLAVPLIVAGQPRYVSSSNISAVAVSTVAVVPNVIGEEEEEAKGIIREEKLNPVSESFLIQGGKDQDKGKVVDQVPKQGELVRLGTKVKLTVSLGPPQPAPEDESAVHLRIEKDVELAQQQILAAQSQIQDAKATILAAIEQTHTSQSGGAEKK